MGFSWTTFALELVNFLVFLWLLQRLFYRPIERAISNRREARREEDERMAAARKQSEQLDAERRKMTVELAELRRQAVEQAREEAQRVRASLVERATAEATDLRRREQERLKLERLRVQAEIADSSLDAARRSVEALLASLVLPQLDASLTSRLIDEARHQRSEVCQPAEAELVSAAALDAPAQDAFRLSLAEALGTPVTVQIVHEPSLLFGAKLLLGDRIYDWSLSGQLDGVVAKARTTLSNRLRANEWPASA